MYEKHRDVLDLDDDKGDQLSRPMETGNLDLSGSEIDDEPLSVLPHDDGKRASARFLMKMGTV